MNRSRPLTLLAAALPHEMSSIDISGELSAEVSLVGGVDGRLEPGLRVIVPCHANDESPVHGAPTTAAKGARARSGPACHSAPRLGSRCAGGLATGALPDKRIGR
jgi:hypothetical protein